jgi:hypothetical protein
MDHVSQSKRSPHSDGPAFNPGRLFDQQIHGLIHSFVTGPVVVAFSFLLFAALEWLRYYRPYPPEPVVYSTLAAIVLIYAAIRMLLLWPRVRALKRSRDREKIVEQFRDPLRQRGYRIFHHVAGKGFDLDCVLIGPAGIFTVETQSRHTAIKGDAPVIFEAEKIRVNGFEPEGDAIAKAKRHAKWLRGLLTEGTNREFTVHPVILYADGSVEWRGPKSHSVWVLEPKWLTSFLDHEPVRLSSDDIRLASFHLGRFLSGD